MFPPVPRSLSKMHWMLLTFEILSFVKTNDCNTLIPDDYNKFEAPGFEGETTHVYVFLQVMEIDEISEANMVLGKIGRKNITILSSDNTKHARIVELKKEELFVSANGAAMTHDDGFELRRSSLSSNTPTHTQRVPISEVSRFRAISPLYSSVCQMVYHAIGESVDFRIHFYLDDIWRDSRLKLENFQSGRMRMLPEETVKRMWKPDIVFENAKSGHIFELSLPNTFVKVLHDGSIYRTARYNLRVSCPMNLHNYPMDTQHCHVSIGSLGNPTSIMELCWIQDEGSPYTDIAENIEFTFDIAPLKYDIRQPRAEKRMEHWVSGSFTTLKANFTFVRSVSSHVVNTYIPSTLVVIMSWLSFWLDVNVAPGRITLGVTSLLTLATQGVRTRSALPPISYMTAMDIWLFFCVLMVFASLVEYALAYHIVTSKSEENETKVFTASSNRKSSVDFNSTMQKIDTPDVLNTSFVKKLKLLVTDQWSKYLQSPNKLDSMCRVIFPFVFAIFSISYWSYYLCRYL